MLFFINSIDTYINTFFIGLAKNNPTLVNIFKVITFFGTFEFIAISIIILLLFLYLQKNFKKNYKSYFFIIVTSNIISLFITYFLKYYFNTPGPIGRIPLEFTPSFPSAHASGSLVFYSLLFLIFSKNIKNKNRKSLFLFFIISIIFLIGLSRLVLNVHFLSDILVGYIIGLFGLFITINIKKKLYTKK